MDCVIEATKEEYVNGWVHERLCAGWKTSACAGHEVVRGAVLRGRPACYLPGRLKGRLCITTDLRSPLVTAVQDSHTGSIHGTWLKCAQFLFLLFGTLGASEDMCFSPILEKSLAIIC